MTTFKNTNFTKRNYECTNVVFCQAETAPDANWVECEGATSMALHMFKVSHLYLTAVLRFTMAGCSCKEHSWVIVPSATECDPLSSAPLFPGCADRRDAVSGHVPEDSAADCTGNAGAVPKRSPLCWPTPTTGTQSLGASIHLPTMLQTFAAIISRRSLPNVGPAGAWASCVCKEADGCRRFAPLKGAVAWRTLRLIPELWRQTNRAMGVDSDA